MRCQGYVTVLHVNGDWQRRLRVLPTGFSLSKRTIRQIVNFVEQRPLHKKCGVHPDWMEHKLENLEGWTLFYTNHHFFPTLWLVKRTRDFAASAPQAILDYRALMDFYIKGQECYQRVEVHGESLFHVISQEARLFCGALPAQWRDIQAAMPDNLRRDFF